MGLIEIALFTASTTSTGDISWFQLVVLGSSAMLWLAWHILIIPYESFKSIAMMMVSQAGLILGISFTTIINDPTLNAVQLESYGDTIMAIFMFKICVFFCVQLGEIIYKLYQFYKERRYSVKPISNSTIEKNELEPKIVPVDTPRKGPI